MADASKLEDRTNRARRLQAGEPNYSWVQRGRRHASQDDRLAGYWQAVEAGVLVYSAWPRLQAGR